MSEPFLAEIRIFGFNFAPRGWAFCNGQLLPIAQNTALFSLLGTTFGGDGRTTLALPDLRDRAALHPGRGPGLTARRLGEKGGAQFVTLTEAQIPAHAHAPARGSDLAADQLSPAGNVWAVGATRRATVNYYSATPGSSPQMSPQSFGPVGGGQAHNNMPPYLTLSFCIALVGLYPSRS